MKLAKRPTTLKAKLQTKLQNPKYRLIAIAVTIALACCLVIGIKWGHEKSYLVNQAFTVVTYKPKVEAALHEELQPLKTQLTDMRFNDLDNTMTHCYYSAPPQFIDDLGMDDVPKVSLKDYALDCTSSVSRIVRIPQDASSKQHFLEQFVAFDKTLRANGWQLDDKTPTPIWFQKLLSGNTSQIAHEFSKTHNNLRCNVTFWTNYTAPEPPSVGAAVNCLKP